MSDTKQSGGPAFPSASDLVTDIYGNDVSSGMDLRDWFAGSLDVGDIQFPDFAIAADWMGIDQPDATDFIAMLEFTFKLDAFIRYKKADAMLAARAKNEHEAAITAN